MKNPLRDLSRPKALGLAGLAAGALTVSAAAAAVNVGLLNAHQTPTFSTTPVAETGAVKVAASTTSEAPPAQVVYQDVYEHVAAPAPVALPSSSSQGDDNIDDAQGADDSSDEMTETESDDEMDHESEDESESEDGHESEDPGTDDGGIDD